MEQLGIQPIQLLTQVFNFVVMIVLLSKFLYKPILKALEARKKKIQDGLAYTQKMEEEAQKNEKRREEIISRAKEEARQIVEEGKIAGKRMETEILTKAQAEANSILEKGRQELVMEKAEMENQLRRQTVEIAKSWVEAVLTKTLGIKTQQTIINKKIQEMAKLSK